MRFRGQPGGIQRNLADFKGQCQEKPRRSIEIWCWAKKILRNTSQRPRSLGKLKEILRKCQGIYEKPIKISGARCLEILSKPKAFGGITGKTE